MKSIFICMVVFVFAITNAQTKMYINKTSGGTDSIALSEIKGISFKALPPAPLNFFFADSFNTDLSKWTKYAGDCNGTWDIVGGELKANYTISCGSVYNSQSQLILNDAYQPNTNHWKVDVNFKKATDPNFPAYSQIATEFAVYLSSSQKIRLMIGTGGDNLPASVDSVAIYYNE